MHEILSITVSQTTVPKGTNYKGKKKGTRGKMGHLLREGYNGEVIGAQPLYA